MKTAAPSVHAYHEDPTEIILEIDGLIDRGDGSFALRGVRPINLDFKHFEAMSEALITQGIPRQLALRLTEEAHGNIQTGLLADAIAQRTRRIG